MGCGGEEISICSALLELHGRGLLGILIFDQLLDMIW